MTDSMSEGAPDRQIAGTGISDDVRRNDEKIPQTSVGLPGMDVEMMSDSMSKLVPDRQIAGTGTRNDVRLNGRMGA